MSLTVCDGWSVKGGTLLTAGYEVLANADWRQDDAPAAGTVSPGDQSSTFRTLAAPAIAAETQNLHFSVGLTVTGPGGSACRRSPFGLFDKLSTFFETA